ncbi:Dicer-like protein 1 [Geranomyces variabilis]|uniref:Dicer-like protein 1 n=1 Tax=Geranomyces variabilis TaxID=109894 RepID=A0AAD5TJL5_9FUNG|nr:Dicer-like protein 1 [Geranomyces variabilis]
MTVDPPVELQNSLVSPRSYQLDLLSRAKKGNVVAVLDTGSGKTLISVLLIKHVLQDEHNKRVYSRPCIFLVPLVPLVLQQEAYIRNSCTAKVRHYYGAMGVDSWPAERWTEAFKEADVMVMTADIFKLLLNRGYFTMEDVSLVIFDEAHHARKNHSYNQIMSLHYTRCAENQRPKIFGMTASPTFAKEDSKKSIEQLERNLDCKAFTAPPEAVAAHVSKAQEEVLWYHGTSNADPPGTYFLLWHAAGAALPLLKPLLKASLEVCATLGPWCAERSLEQGVVDAALKLAAQRFQRQHNAHLQIGVDEQEQLRIAESVANLKNYITTSPHAAKGGITPHFGCISPKVGALVKLLQSYREDAEGFCAIIFVEKRSTAKILSEVVDRFPGLDFVKHAVLVGHGSGGGNALDPNMTIPQQHAIVEKFKSGQLNVLIATKVAEEGLDIRTCMLVIRFDGGGTLTNFIQSRGRARHANSRFIILADKLNPIAAIDLVGLKQEEILMRDELRGRDEDENDQLFDSQLVLTPEMVLTVESTGASLTIYESIGAVFQYCNSLPQDTYVDTKPVFQVVQCAGGFVGSVTLPMAAPISTRFIEGRLCGRTRDAKRWAAFEAAKRLHAAGELDDRLKPLRLTTVTVNDEVINEAITLARHAKEPTTAKKNAVQDFRMGTPRALAGTWNKSLTRAWLAKIKIRVPGGDEYQSTEFGILTTGEKPLPEDIFSIKFAEGAVLDISIVPLPGPCMVLDVDQVATVKRFHEMLFKGMLRSQVPDEADWALIIVPLRQCTVTADDTLAESVIDWDVANAARKEMIPVLEVPDFLDKPNIDHFVLYDRIHYRRVYLVDKVLNQHTPTSNFPTGNEKFSNLASYYKVRLGCKEDILVNQPIIEARVLPYITQGAREAETMHAAFLIPQFCMVYPLPARLLRGHALHLPAVIQHVQLRLLAMELKYESFCNSGTDEEWRVLAGTVDDLQSALTAPVTQSVDNYERFETYGDSFLKVHQTLHLFASQPKWHEGLLSEARNHLERNSALRSRAFNLKLERFISGTPLSRKAWIPPLQNDGGGLVQRLSDKMVADVVEALIGACVYTGGNVGGAKAVKKILGGSYEFDWTVYKQMLLQGQQEPTAAAKAFCEFRSSVIREVEESIGYHFRTPQLAVEALTHASALQLASEVNSYQRLEFLGDAVLGFVVTRFFFNLKPALNPGDLTQLRSELVNNQFLSCVAWRIQLPKMLEHMDSGLASAIATFGSLFDAAVEAPRLNPDQHEKNLFWTSLAASPKAAGDVYEAMLGAVFLDSDFDVEAVWRVVEKTMIDPWWHFFAASGLTKLAAAAPIATALQSAPLTVGAPPPLAEATFSDALAPSAPASTVSGISGPVVSKATGSDALTPEITKSTISSNLAPVVPAALRSPVLPQLSLPLAYKVPGELQQVSEWAAMNGCRDINNRCEQDPVTLAFTFTFLFHGREVGQGRGPSKKVAKRLATVQSMTVLPQLLAAGKCTCQVDFSTKVGKRRMLEQAALTLSSSDATLQSARPPLPESPPLSYPPQTGPNGSDVLGSVTVQRIAHNPVTRSDVPGTVTIQRTSVAPISPQTVVQVVGGSSPLPQSSLPLASGTLAQEVSNWAQMNGCKEIDTRCKQDPRTLAFTFTFLFHGREVGSGQGPSKKVAKRLATTKSLEVLPRLLAAGECTCQIDLGTKSGKRRIREQAAFAQFSYNNDMPD